MTRAQRQVLVIAGVVAVLMLLFPPWETLGGHYLGHSPILSPPGYEVPPIEGLGGEHPSPDPIARVSLSLLTAQYAALWIGAGALFLLRGRSRRR